MCVNYSFLHNKTSFLGPTSSIQFCSSVCRETLRDVCGDRSTLSSSVTSLHQFLISSLSIMHQGLFLPESSVTSVQQLQWSLESLSFFTCWEVSVFLHFCLPCNLIFVRRSPRRARVDPAVQGPFCWLSRSWGVLS